MTSPPPDLDPWRLRNARLREKAYVRGGSYLCIGNNRERVVRSEALTKAVLKKIRCLHQRMCRKVLSLLLVEQCDCTLRPTHSSAPALLGFIVCDLADTCLVDAYAKQSWGLCVHLSVGTAAPYEKSTSWTLWSSARAPHTTNGRAARALVVETHTWMQHVHQGHKIVRSATTYFQTSGRPASLELFDVVVEYVAAVC